MRVHVLPTVLVAAIVLAGCSGSTGSGAPERPMVTVTTDILGDVVDEIVGDQADVVVLMPAGSDPHSFAISAQDAARMRSSDLLVANGLGLEEGVTAHLAAAAADGVPLLVAGDYADPLTFAAGDSAGRPTRTSGPTRIGSHWPSALSTTRWPGSRASTPSGSPDDRPPIAPHSSRWSPRWSRPSRPSRRSTGR